MMMSNIKLLVTTISIFLSSSSFASNIDETMCYDAKIQATPIEQIPSVYYQSSDPNEIIISWPWFLDLKVKKVIIGNVPQPIVTALAVLHTPYIKKNMMFLLRRNSGGSFNIVRTNDNSSVPRCGADVVTEEPYLRLANGKTLDDARREGEEASRRYSER